MRLHDEVEKVTGDYSFVGVIVADFKKLDGARRLAVEDDRGVVHIYSEKNLKVIDDKDGFGLRCSTTVFGLAATFWEARRFLENHIRTCPEGAMPWATDIAWHSIPGIGWNCAAKGEWLNHAVLRSRVSGPLTQAAKALLEGSLPSDPLAVDTA